MGCILELSRLCSLKYPTFVFSWSHRRFFSGFRTTIFLCIIYCMIRSGISNVDISLSFMVHGHMTEKEMYLPRPLSLHVNLISLFCMRIHSGLMIRDRTVFLCCSCTGTLNQHLKSFYISEVHAWCS